MPPEIVANREIYERVIVETVSDCRQYLWIATADIKDLHVTNGRAARPFLAVLSGLIEEGISIRLIHAKEPGPAFREDYDRYPNLIEGMEMLLCPRAHFKMLIADGKMAYTGSANLTGAGMGAKSERRRNFEAGILTDDAHLIRPLMAQFDALWNGSRCEPCQRKAHCATYDELIG